MANRRKQWLIILAQLVIFYLFPLLSKPIGAMIAVFFMIAATFALAVGMGASSVGSIKWLYPVLVAALFAPSVFLYYNESAFVQVGWYFVVSLLGVSLGALRRHFSLKQHRQ